MQTTGNAPGAARPTGLPADPLDAAHTLAETLAERINVPGPGRHGLLMPSGLSEQMAAAAQVTTALALVDIAESLRLLAGRTTADH